jgi:hypothetical protein
MPESATPSGSPAQSATVMPADTTAMARPRRSGGTIRAAYPASSAHSVPPITPASSRAPKVSGYQDDRAVIRFSSANPHSTVTSTGRRGRPRRVTTTGIAVSTPVTA